MALIFAMSLGAMVIGSAAVARHRAQASADLAALAAGGELASGTESACAWAGVVAGRMRTHLAQCRVEQLDVIVSVEVPVDIGRWGLGSAIASARAGPVESPG